MNKRHVLLLTAVLGMASSSTLAQSTTAAPPTDAVVKGAAKDTTLSSALVTVNTGVFRGPLSVLLSALAKSAGYDTVYDFNVDALPLIDGSGVPSSASGTTSTSYSTATGKPQELGAKPIAYSVVNRPFNEVWPLLMDIYELRYEVIQLGSGQILRISQRPSQASIVLKKARAVDAVARAKEFLGTQIVDKDGILQGYAFDSKTMKAIPDIAANRVIVGGTAEEVKKILAFLEEIDRETGASNEALPQVQVIYTANGKAADLQTLLRAEYRNVTVNALPGTNQLVISGPQDAVTSAQALLSKVDPGTEVNAQARPTVQRVYKVLGNQDEMLKFLGDQFPTVKVVPVGKSGQLVLNGETQQVTAALTLLGQVDISAAPTATTVQKVFQLVNASAEEVKATLEGTLQKEVTSTAQRGTGTTLLDVNGNPISALVPPSQQASADAQGLKTTDLSGTTPTTAPDMPNIIADKRTNTIIVRGTPVQVDQVAELIPQLDKVVPQINVQVRIQELTDSATRSLGLNANLNFGGFSIGTSSGNGLAATFDPTKTLMGFNIFPTLTALETQNLARRVYDGNVTMQSGQRALGGTSQTENASSTAAASVKSGGSLEINIPSQAANIPSIQKTIDYGVILDFFSPQVAPDGTITVRVRGKVNTPPTNITANNIPYVLNFQNSEAQSLVSFKSGETLLLAGLMGNTAANGSTGIPYLSKFGIGGTTTKDSKFSQLLVIITGTIVK